MQGHGMAGSRNLSPDQAHLKHVPHAVRPLPELGCLYVRLLSGPLAARRHPRTLDAGIPCNPGGAHHPLALSENWRPPAHRAFHNRRHNLPATRKTKRSLGTRSTVFLYLSLPPFAPPFPDPDCQRSKILICLYFQSSSCVPSESYGIKHPVPLKSLEIVAALSPPKIKIQFLF